MLKIKRIIFWGVFSFICLSFLLGRLIQIQLVDTKSFTKHGINILEASVKQRSQEVILDSGRGNFLDRNGDPLIYDQLPVLILFPFLNKMDWDADKVAQIVGIESDTLKKMIKKADKPFALGDPNPIRLSESQMKKINKLEIPGVFAVERKYLLEKTPAEQLIGIVKENQQELAKRYPDKEFPQQTLLGISGLEKSFDEFLIAEGKSKLVYHVDGDGAPLFGVNVKYVDSANPYYPVNIKTTIDKQMQTTAEKLVDQQGIKKGGLVLLDVKTNNVLALVSRPSINRKDPYVDNGIDNLMVKQQIPGSVFKTVVAAAAIDYNLNDPTRTFDCSRKINGEPDLKYNHGILNFKDSFARSCNRTFGEISNELKDINPNIIEEYAQKLGLIGTNGWKGSVFHLDQFSQIPDEDKGRVFISENAKKDKNFVSMTGIGQHEVRVTPLGVANMMATIARGGEKDTVRVASSIQYQNGTTMFEFPKSKGSGETIAPYTAMKLQELLREVVVNDHGTGRWFKDLPYAVAGKSGTAETGKYVNDQQLHNKWFAGYFPFDHPKYVLVTVNLDVPENEGGVNQLFADMVSALYDIDQRNSD
ncbi:penicillin-binding protein 2 [Bacillus sp. T3]|uniref:peptidoglycan D,D-transpeptidase FtsI family protein n=1 Tax=Bacillus sp. T3 TaxID=467262 RepID=UPI0029820443|nr:penicillin-binding protein 2 [Bacillus sp. T3]